MKKRISNILSSITLNDFIAIALCFLLLVFSNISSYAIQFLTLTSSFWILLFPLFFVVLFAWFKTKKGYLHRGWFTFLRMWSPWILGVLFYENLTYLTSKLKLNLINNILIKIDLFLFGFHPSVFLESFINPFLTDYFTAVYIFGYTLVPPLLGLLFYLINKDFAYKYIRAILLAMVIGFACYILLPAVQPNVYCPDCYSITLEGNVIHDSNEFRNSVDTYVKNAFPSLHTAITTIMLLYAFKFNKKLALLIFPISLSVWISTLYLRAHYFTDLLTAWVIVFLIIKFSDDLETIFQKAKLRFIAFLQ